MYKLFYLLLFVNHYCTKKKAATLESRPFPAFRPILQPLDDRGLILDAADGQCFRYLFCGHHIRFSVVHAKAEYRPGSVLLWFKEDV